MKKSICVSVEWIRYLKVIKPVLECNWVVYYINEKIITNRTVKVAFKIIATRISRNIGSCKQRLLST